MWLFDAFRATPSPLVQKGTQTVGEMLKTSAAMFDAATACLLDNEPLSVDLRAMDDAVNEGEQEVRRLVLEHLAVSPQDDLSWSLLLLSAIQDAERSGDLSKSLSKAAALADAPRQGAHTEVLRAIRDDVQVMFTDTQQAFTSGDAPDARRVLASNAALKERTASLIEAIAADASLTPNAATVFALSARMIGRMGSHLANIASLVALPFDEARNAGLAKAA
jgi:phosphate uptake regulator